MGFFIVVLNPLFLKHILFVSPEMSFSFDQALCLSLTKCDQLSEHTINVSNIAPLPSSFSSCTLPPVL